MSCYLHGSANPAWTGGKPTWVCRVCGVTFAKYRLNGADRTYCSASCYSAAKRGAGNPNWKGGVARDGWGGYGGRYMPEHPRAINGCYVGEHILVAERALGKLLPPAAVVHHVNEDRRDNRPENLVICQDQAYHALLHSRMRERTESGTFKKKGGA